METYGKIEMEMGLFVSFTPFFEGFLKPTN